MEFCFLQSLRLASQATSLYTREAYYRPTVYLKGVTHYTLQSKACEKEYEQIARTPFVVERGGYLPPFYLHISFVFGGSKPPPYLLYGRCSLRTPFYYFGGPEGSRSCFFLDAWTEFFVASRKKLRSSFAKQLTELFFSLRSSPFITSRKITKGALAYAFFIFWWTRGESFLLFARCFGLNFL